MTSELLHAAERRIDPDRAAFGGRAAAARSRSGQGATPTASSPSSGTSRRPRDDGRGGALVAISLLLAGCTGAVPVPVASNGGPSIAPPSAEPTPTASATPIAPAGSGPSYQPSAVAFWNATDGIVGVIVSSSDGSTQTGELLRTTDGGRTWTKAEETNGRIEQLVVAGPTDAWAVVGCPSDGPDTCTTLSRSTDGGATWAATGTSGATRVSFVDADRGFGVFPGTDPFKGELRRTVDGGSTWTAAGDPCAGSHVGGLGNIAFASATDGLAVCSGEPGAGNQLKAVAGTDDGGTSWHLRASTGDLSGSSGDGRVGSISVGGYVGRYGDLVVAHDGTAWMTGGRMTPLVARNGGSTWVPLGLGDPDVNLVRSAWPLDRERGFALVWEGDRQATLLESTGDGGRTWTELSLWPVGG